MTILQVLNLGKDYDHRTIWSEVSFQLEAGEKVALIGTNGCGKSTLLRILAGGDQATKGLIQPIKPDLRIGYLGQDWEQRTLGTPLNSVMSGEPSLGALKNKLQEAENNLGPDPSPDLMDRYLQLLTDYQNAEGYEHEQRAHTLLRKMGLTDAEIELPMASLSGGQRTRVGLARALFSQPDLLLLDEPTTHLDVDALEWLEETLRRYDGTVLVVSHDRYFLDAVTTRTLELDSGHLESFDGSYSDYVQQKQHRLQSQTAAYQKQQSEIKQIEAAIQRQKQWFLKASIGPVGDNQDGFFIGKYRDRATKQAAGFKAKEMRLQHINDHHVDKPWESRKLNMRLHERQSNARWLVRAQELTMAFPEKSLFRSANLMLERDSRVAILGPNGCGKTTLLRVLMGELEPTAGSVERAGFTVGYFGQEADTLDPNLTILAEIQSTGVTDQTDARTLAGAFLFRGEDVYKKVSLLSSGEKARLALAKLVAKHPDLLVLDEPTNHLDIPSREQVEGVLTGYEGTMILVSHDRYLLRKLATDIWAFKDGSVVPYPGSYDEYLVKSGRRVLAAAHPERESLLNQLAVCETRLALVSGKLAACPAQDAEQMDALTQEFMSISEEIESIKASLNDTVKPNKRA